MLGIARTNQGQDIPERRMDVELTVAEIQKMYLLAVRARASEMDRDPVTVSLARKMTECRRRSAS